MSIQKGYIQETSLTRSQANSLIGRLERKHLIPLGEFRVRLFREGDKPKVGIAHEEPGEGRARSIDSDRAKLPKPEEAAAFIEDQPSYRHDISLLAEHYLGRSVSADTEGALYHVLRDLLHEAQQLILRKHGGKFTSQIIRRRKYYEWSNIKQ
jgi:hypothetical protein